MNGGREREPWVTEVLFLLEGLGCVMRHRVILGHRVFLEYKLEMADEFFIGAYPIAAF